jgi:aspartate dehydrogenase
MERKIGLIGFGLIGQYIYNKCAQRKRLEVDFVFDADPTKIQSLPPSQQVETVEDLELRSVDIVVEAAHPAAVKELGEVILQRSDLLIFSMTALADDELREQLVTCARQSNRRILFPHGAILGLDGIFDGRKVIDTVKITTVKHPRNLGLPGSTMETTTVVYQGSTREACRRFPRNVNVHAAVALAGIGFDNTVSKIVADPHTDQMRHRIEVMGTGLAWVIDIESRSVGEVTGSYTPESAYQTVRRLGEYRAGLQLA